MTSCSSCGAPSPGTSCPVCLGDPGATARLAPAAVLDVVEKERIRVVVAVARVGVLLTWLVGLALVVGQS